MDSVAHPPPTVKWLLLSTAKVNRHVVASLKLSMKGPPAATAAPGGSTVCAKNELYAVASRTSESAQKYAAENDIPVSYGSYQEGIEDPNVDVVYISLPNEYHYEWVLKALKAKKHVLVEKPIALTVAQTAEMFSVARQESRLLLEGYMFTFTELTTQVKKKLSDLTGKFTGDGKPLPSGEERPGAVVVPSTGGWALQEVHGRFSFEIKDRGGHRVGTPATGGGAIWDIGCYLICYCTILRGLIPAAGGGAGNHFIPPVIREKEQELSPDGSCVMAADFELVYTDGFKARFHVSFLEPVQQELNVVLHNRSAVPSPPQEVQQEAGPPGLSAVLALPNPFKPEPAASSPASSSDIIAENKGTPMILTTHTLYQDVTAGGRSMDEPHDVEETLVPEVWDHLYRGQVEALGAAVHKFRGLTNSTAASSTEGGSGEVDSYGEAVALLQASGALSNDQCLANVHILEALHKKN